MSEDINGLLNRYKTLQARRQTLAEHKIKLDAELIARKRSLKDALDECRSLGLDPDDLDKQISNLKETITVKLDLFEADLLTAEKQILPMIKEIS